MDESGQASVELVAGLPALLLAAVVALQLLAAGYALTLADGAAEAGALALAAGQRAPAAARAAVPGWARGRTSISVAGGRVTVELRPPSPLPGLGERLAVRCSFHRVHFGVVLGTANFVFGVERCERAVGPWRRQPRLSH